MANINIIFCRSMLSLVMAYVNKVTTAADRKKVWVYDFGRDHWEFHGPNGFYWHGSADNAYDARAKGWSRWLEERGEVVDTTTRAVIGNKSLFSYGHVVYKGRPGGWIFIPNVAGRHTSRKFWPTPEAAVPRWVGKWHFQKPMPRTHVGEV